MGQAAVDLPDPLDQPPTSLAGTDDLLAQMAGDEIDRLLAESGVEPAAPAMPPKAQAAATPPPNPTESAAESRGPASRAPVVVESAATEADDVIAADAPPLSPAQLESDAELDALLDEMSRAERDGLGGTPPPPPQSVAAPAPPVPAPAKPAERVAEVAPARSQLPASAAAMTTLVGTDAADASESLMSSAERDALSLSDLGAATDAASPDAGGADRPSLMVRVLEFLNAPLMFVPDGVRDLLGKVAILTLVNALAVLIYVLFFRG
jgi:hypothetical protein